MKPALSAGMISFSSRSAKSGVESANVSLLSVLLDLASVDRRLHQRRSRPARLDHAVIALHLEPLAQQANLGERPHAVGAFDRDDLARIAADRR